MKYCPNCGAQAHENAVVCVRCGCSLAVRSMVPAHNASKENGMDIAIKVFLILGCVAQGWLILPLAWCIPMTVSIFRSIKEGRPIGTGMKVCTLLFVSLVSGILLLCTDKYD